MPLDFPSNPGVGQVYENYVYDGETWRVGSSPVGLETRVALIEQLVVPGTIHPYAGASAPNGYLFCQGQAVSRSTYPLLFNAIGTTYGSGDGSTTFNLPDLQGRTPAGVNTPITLGTATITIASPAVVTEAGHGLATGNIVYFTTTGALPTGLSANTRYWAIVVDANTFRLATTLANALAGTAINTSGSQSGTHTVYEANYDLGRANGTETHTLTVTELPSHTHIQNPHNHTQDQHRHRNRFATGYVGQSDWLAVDANNTALAWGGDTENTTATNIATTATNQNTGGGGAHNNLQPYNTVNYIIKF